MRIAATADLHFTPQSYSVLQEQFAKVRDEADLLILAGDLTNFGKASEIEPLISALIRLQVPIVAVLGNHDYESGEEVRIAQMLSAEGIKVLDGSGYEKDGVGFAGTKDKPIPMLQKEVDAMLAQVRASEEKARPKIEFTVGEMVKVADGPFQNQTGVVQEIDPERGKLVVSVSIFGRETPVDLEYWQVERNV